MQFGHTLLSDLSHYTEQEENIGYGGSQFENPRREFS